MTGDNLSAPPAGPCPICETYVDTVRDHLADAHPTGDWGPYRGSVDQPDEEAIGPGRAALYALGIWPARTITRETLAALVHSTLSARHQSAKVSKSLRSLERDGLARRHPEHVEILDRTAVYARAVDRIDNPRHDRFLTIETAIPTIREQIAREKRALVIEQRERELRFIESLMGGPYGRGLPGDGTGRRVVGAGRTH